MFARVNMAWDVPPKDDREKDLPLSDEQHEAVKVVTAPDNRSWVDEEIEQPPLGEREQVVDMTTPHAFDTQPEVEGIDS
ncbi:hypothetical protein U1Q18_042257 [Sarracenia purpurea var. burkii]